MILDLIDFLKMLELKSSYINNVIINTVLNRYKLQN